MRPAACSGCVSFLLQIDLRSDQERKLDKQPLLLEGAEVRTVKRNGRMAEVGQLHACLCRQLWQEHRASASFFLVPAVCTGSVCSRPA